MLSIAPPADTPTHGFVFEGDERRVLTSIIAIDDHHQPRFVCKELHVSMTSIPRSLPFGQPPSLSCAMVRISRAGRRSKSNSTPRPKPARLFLVTGKIATTERIRRTVAAGGNDENNDDDTNQRAPIQPMHVGDPFPVGARIALYYNFVHIHKRLKTPPAMAAGVTDRLWEVADVVDVLETWEGT